MPKGGCFDCAYLAESGGYLNGQQPVCLNKMVQKTMLEKSMKYLNPRGLSTGCALQSEEKDSDSVGESRAAWQITYEMKLRRDQEVEEERIVQEADPKILQGQLF